MENWGGGEDECANSIFEHGFVGGGICAVVLICNNGHVLVDE